MFYSKKKLLEGHEIRPSKLADRQWSCVLILGLLFLFSGILTKNIMGILDNLGLETNPILQTIIGFTIGIIVFLVLVPRVLGLPFGKTSISHYLKLIGINRPVSIKRLSIIFLPCIGFLFLSWVLASVLYYVLFLNWSQFLFIRRFLDFSRALPPESWSLITAFPSIFEEVVFRGIFITMLLEKYSERKSIGISATAFGLFHIMNFTNGPLTNELIASVLAQLVYATIHGLFYGYIFVKTKNLIPNMIIHYVGNGFINFWWYMPGVSQPVYLAFMLLLYIGLLPTLLMSLWVKFSVRWYPQDDTEISLSPNL
jgi:membrane protease YdiL (CAAX protease family)